MVNSHAKTPPPTDPCLAFTVPKGTRSKSRKQSRRSHKDEKYLARCLVKLARGSSEIIKPPASFARNFLEQESVKAITEVKNEHEKSALTTMDVTKDQEKSALTTMDVKEDQENSALTTILMDLKKGQEPNLYVCDVCDESFLSHQALGGHKSKHSSKPRKVVSGVKKGVKVSSTGEKVHQCRTCEKIFDSGQALGGHMRVHYEGVIGAGVYAKRRSVEAVKSPSNEVSSGRVVADFDLNVAWTEDNLYYDQVQSAMILV